MQVIPKQRKNIVAGAATGYRYENQKHHTKDKAANANFLGFSEYITTPRFQIICTNICHAMIAFGYCWKWI